MEAIKRICFVGDTHHYKIIVDTKSKKCVIDMPVYRAEAKTIDGYTLICKDYKNIRLVFNADKIVPLTSLVMTYVPGAFYCWCVEWDYGYIPFIHIEVM